MHSLRTTWALPSKWGPRTRAQKGQQQCLTRQPGSPIPSPHLPTSQPVLKCTDPQVLGALQRIDTRHITSKHKQKITVGNEKMSCLGNTSENDKLLLTSKRNQE